ncbi:MAG: GMC family oxidoreductase N-terminal domain-containing protein [Streptosporangiaceae bacterium]|nr:GMC family oxidoreductase N-terminal domain-containing protein [Streptosporangiaceae bacterium]
MPDTAAYDYIIAGAGSAGCVLAARLSADSGVRVLLLEAGPADDAIEIRAPAALARLFQTAYDWNYRTVPQHYAAGRSLYWPRGKVLGGSSSMNAMIYIRGHRADYDAWRDEYGCTGWGYADLMPYFRRAEDNSRGASPYHGAGGPLAVTDARYKSASCEAFVAAAHEQGAAANDDFNGPRQDGVGWYQVTQRAGRRCSAATAYLHPAATRPNLTVRTEALVTKVLIEGGRATGVHYLDRGEPVTARADAEVILCGGAVNSPQLLMLSGIGPADHLVDSGIAVAADSPGVGANLSDHPMLPVAWSTPRVRGLWEKTGNAGVLRWQLTHRGPLASNIAEAGGFAHSAPGLPAPDIQLYALPAAFRDQGLADPAERAMTVLVGLVDVKSRGRITLRSADPRHRPAIDPGYLSDADSADARALVAGLKMAREFVTARPMATICDSELAPGVQVRSDAELLAYVQASIVTMYHPVGTCAIGPQSRQGSVVDPELRVHGVAGLRVADASVMPAAPRGNTNAPTIAIAERAADLIAGRAPLAAADPGHPIDAMVIVGQAAARPAPG